MKMSTKTKADNSKINISQRNQKTIIAVFKSKYQQFGKL